MRPAVEPSIATLTAYTEFAQFLTLDLPVSSNAMHAGLASHPIIGSENKAFLTWTD
jgi:hypothetical protein